MDITINFPSSINNKLGGIDTLFIKNKLFTQSYLILPNNVEFAVKLNFNSLSNMEIKQD